MDFDKFLENYFAEAKKVNKELADSISANVDQINSVSAANHKRLLMESLNKIQQRSSSLKVELASLIKLQRAKNEFLRSQLETETELSQNLLSQNKKDEKEAEKINDDEKENVVNGEENAEMKVSGDVIRKPLLSDYNFSKETLAFLNDEIVTTNSAVKPPRLSDYDLYSMRKKKIDRSFLHAENKTILKDFNNCATNNKITPSKFYEWAFVITDSDDADSSNGKQQNCVKSNKSLLHSGSLDGSLIKVSPRCEFDLKFNCQQLQKPDFDSTSDDTTTITIVQRPQMPKLTANLEVCSANLPMKPEFPKLLTQDSDNDSPAIFEKKPFAIGNSAFKPFLQRKTSDDRMGVVQRPDTSEVISNASSKLTTKPEFPVLLTQTSQPDSPPTFNEPKKPVIGSGAFKPILKRQNIDDYRRSTTFDVNVTYVVSNNNGELNSTTHFGRICPISSQEYTNVDQFISSKISFTNLNLAISKINEYLKKHDTNILTKEEFAEILPGQEHLHFYYTLILIKCDRLKKLQADDTYFECA